ncbi:MAG: vitamin K epoxide reductase family protein [Acidobacteriota bacterium]
MSPFELRLAQLLLSVGGLWAAITMTGAYYGWWRGPARLVPERLCSPKVGGCMDILSTPYARAFGPPNSLLGIFYYLMLLGLALAGPEAPGAALRAGFMVLSWGVVVFSIYLAWSLIFRLRTACVLCFFSHVVNLGLALALTAAPGGAGS